MTFEKCYENVWAPTGASTPSELANWRSVMRLDHQKRTRFDLSKDTVIAIGNPKAARALRCKFCNKHPEFSRYADLALFCQDCVPSDAPQWRTVSNKPKKTVGTREAAVIQE